MYISDYQAVIFTVFFLNKIRSHKSWSHTYIYIWCVIWYNMLMNACQVYEKPLLYCSCVYFMCVQGDTGLQGPSGPKGDPGDAVISHILCFYWTALTSHITLKKMCLIRLLCLIGYEGFQGLSWTQRTQWYERRSCKSVLCVYNTFSEL